MSTIPVSPNRQEIIKGAEEIKRKVGDTFPNVDVEIAFWDDLTGENSEYWEHRGFPLPRPWIHAYVLIRGDQETTEEAASLADAEVARLLEETEVVIKIRRTHRVWCKKSVPLVASSLPAVPPYGRSLHEEKRGILFLCSFYEEHDHDFGNLTRVYLASLR
ncbi:MAG: hypothetical protein HW403_879 [Dehalococcoidia bacterium]|nr:hypothetical protein [Dehalococcoidia bacterium]